MFWKEHAGQDRIIIPKQLIEPLLQAAHSIEPAAHEGYQKISNRLYPFFYWPQMRPDIKLFVLACPVCDPFRRRDRSRSELRKIPAGGRLELVAMDLVGGKDSLAVTNHGNKYIFTMIDVFTKFLVAVPIPDQSA